MTEKKHTERTVLDALRTRHKPKASGNNGPEWAYLEHVRSSAGFDAKRTLDAMALHLWPSRGMELHGYEVKVSRADFRREIDDPAKMDAFAPILDRFWIVAPTGIVPAEEIPAAWGLLEVSDAGKIRQKIAAPLLRDKRAEIPRSMLVPLLRAAGAGLEHTPDEAALREAEAAGFERGLKMGKGSSEQRDRDLEQARAERDDARAVTREIDAALGMPVLGPAWKREDRLENLKRVAEAVRVVVRGDEAVEQARGTVRTALEELDRVADRIISNRQWLERDTGITARKEARA